MILIEALWRVCACVCRHVIVAERSWWMGTASVDTCQHVQGLTIRERPAIGFVQHCANEIDGWDPLCTFSLLLSPLFCLSAYYGLKRRRAVTYTGTYIKVHSTDHNHTTQILPFSLTIPFYRSEVPFRTLVRRSLPVLMLKPRQHDVNERIHFLQRQA